MNCLGFVIGGGIVLYVLLLIWGVILDQAYFSDGLPGHRKVSRLSWTGMDGIFKDEDGKLVNMRPKQ